MENRLYAGLSASQDYLVLFYHLQNSFIFFHFTYRIVVALNNLLETLVIGPRRKFQKVKRNYGVDVQTVQQQTFSGLTFSGIVRIPHESPLKNSSISTEFTDSVPEASSSSISIPRTIFDESTVRNSSKQQRIIFVFYKDTSLFRVSLEDTKKTLSRLNSFVIAGSIKGLTVTNLNEPVKIVLQSVARGDVDSTLCSYWDFNLGNWSQEGCRFQSVLSYDRILCSCNHLTNFAMLMVILFIYLQGHMQQYNRPYRLFSFTQWPRFHVCFF